MRRLFQSVFSHFAPDSAGMHPEEVRRARLIVAFSLLGVFFGALFCGFYFWIGHFWGGGIIAVCCVLFALVPGLLRAGASTGRAGNHYCLILLAGFFSLCCVEGGMHGHAVAWLVIIPLCGLLLTSRRGAHLWTALSFLAALLITGVEAFDISPPIRYPMDWHVTVSAMGYSALVVFLFALGLVFEVGRKTAHDRMQHSLRELAAANERLTRLNLEKSEFLGIAAHDLRSPLTVVMAYSEMLAAGDMSAEKANRAAALITREAQRMRRLISDLLDLSAIEEGRVNMEFGPVPVADAVEALLANYQQQAARKSIAFRVNIASHAVALADEKALLQILDNLISNAIKFTKAGGQVGFDAWEDFTHAWMKVSDTGPGLSAEDQSKLFGRFTRLSARPTGGESSHGLGLSIVKRLIDAMGGTIRCESEVGQGTAFLLRLPKASLPPKPATVQAPALPVEGQSANPLPTSAGR